MLIYDVYAKWQTDRRIKTTAKILKGIKYTHKEGQRVIRQGNHVSFGNKRWLIFSNTYVNLGGLRVKVEWANAEQTEIRVTCPQYTGTKEIERL